VVLDGGTFDSVVFTAKNGNDGTIARDGDVLTYSGFEPITDNSNTTNRVIEASAIADEIRISRSGDKIIVESDNAISTFESIEFKIPSSSLTIKSAGYIAGPLGADTVTIESLGQFAADLIIETGSLSGMDDGEDSIALAATQLGSGYSETRKRRIVDEWVAFFGSGPTPIRSLHFLTSAFHADLCDT